MSDESDAPATATGADIKTKGKMDPAKWAEVVYLTEVEGVRGSEIAKRFGVSPSLISRYLTDNNIVLGSKSKKLQEKAVDEAAERVAKIIADFQVDRRRRIMETKIQHYQWSVQLSTTTMKLINDAIAARTALSNLNPDLKALRQAMILIKQARDERYIVLDAVNEIDEATLPGIVIQDLSDDDIRAIQEAGGDNGFDDGDEAPETVELS